MDDERILAEHPDPTKQGTRIARAMYEPVREAVLGALRDRGEVPFGDLAREVEQRTPGLWADASVGWYTTTVKLDLEAKGLIEQVPGSRPQRLRLVG